MKAKPRKRLGLRALAYGGVVALCITTLCTSGCYSSTIVPAQNLSAITVPNRGRELILRDQHGRRVLVGPNSKIRFLVRGGKWTPWVEGRHLYVNRVGASARTRRQASALVARWSDVFAAEVRNISGGKTYGALIATTVLVGVVLILIAGSAKGGGKGLGKLFSGLGKGVARGLTRGALYHGFRMGVHLPHVRVHVAPSPGAAPSPGPADSPTPPPTSAGQPPPTTSERHHHHRRHRQSQVAPTRHRRARPPHPSLPRPGATRCRPSLASPTVGPGSGCWARWAAARTWSPTTA